MLKVVTDKTIFAFVYSKPNTKIEKSSELFIQIYLGRCFCFNEKFSFSADDVINPIAYRILSFSQLRGRGFLVRISESTVRIV